LLIVQIASRSMKQKQLVELLELSLLLTSRKIIACSVALVNDLLTRCDLKLYINGGPQKSAKWRTPEGAFFNAETRFFIALKNGEISRREKKD